MQEFYKLGFQLGLVLSMIKMEIEKTNIEQNNIEEFLELLHKLHRGTIGRGLTL